MADRRAFDDSLTGSEASDAIFGADGNDTIDALGGDDVPGGRRRGRRGRWGIGRRLHAQLLPPRVLRLPATRSPMTIDLPAGTLAATGPTPSIHLRSWRRPRSGGWAWSERSELEPGSPHTVLHSIA